MKKFMFRLIYISLLIAGLVLLNQPTESKTAYEDANSNNYLVVIPASE